MIFKVILIGLAVTVIGIVVFKAIDPNNRVATSTSSSSSLIDDDSVDDESMTIGISGEIVKSGNYVLDEGATMSDLIEAAGGLTDNADERCFYFTATLTEGISYYIPPLYESSDVCGNSPIDKVNINSADESELKTITGISETYASRIVDYREEYGSFETLEGIMNVKGIKSGIFSKLKNEIMLKDS